ncbi:MAG: Smr/MutS family protein [Deltaproteobacteria bacterium]|nr:Smr/MutS family protein [Deltaproteobacteria bacterium]
MNEEWEDLFPEPVRIPIDGILDLHTFSPKEVSDLLPEYLRACFEEGILDVTVIHGKGKGVLRETVHALLKQDPLVSSFHLDREQGNWGVTRVRLVCTESGR